MEEFRKHWATRSRVGQVVRRRHGRGPQQVEDDDGDPERDGRVGHVEGPEVPAAPVNVHEVHDVPLADPIDQIAGRPAEDQREPKPCEPVGRGQLRGVERHSDQRAQRDDCDHDRLAGKLDGVQEPERRARVPHVRQVEQPADDRNALVQPQLEDHEELGELVGHNHQRNHQPLESAAHQRVRRRHDRTGSASASRQRPQRPSRPGSLRHRRHVPPAALALHPRSAVRCDARWPVAVGLPQVHFRDDEQRRQVGGMPAQPVGLIAPGLDRKTGTKRVADHLLLALPLDLDVGLVAQEQQLRPVVDDRAIDERLERRPVRELRHVHRHLARAGQHLPQLFGGDRQHRRHEPCEAVGHRVHHGLRCAPASRSRCQV